MCTQSFLVHQWACRSKHFDSDPVRSARLGNRWDSFMPRFSWRVHGGAVEGSWAFICNWTWRLVVVVLMMPCNMKRCFSGLMATCIFGRWRWSWWWWWWCGELNQQQRRLVSSGVDHRLSVYSVIFSWLVLQSEEEEEEECLIDLKAGFPGRPAPEAAN